MKREFIDFIEALMRAAPEVVEEKGTDEIMACIEALKGNIEQKTALTEKGAKVLKFLRASEATLLKARDIADAVGLNSRTVSGTLRKLVNDGYVDKIGSQPVLYSITEQGKNFDIEGEN